MNDGKQQTVPRRAERSSRSSRANELRYQSGFGNHFTSEAVAGALPEVGEDLRYSMTNSPEPAAWPVSGTTWAVFDRDMPAGPTREALVALFRWMIHQGQADCASLGYAPVPSRLVDSVDPKWMALAGPATAGGAGSTLAR